MIWSISVIEIGGIIINKRILESNYGKDLVNLYLIVGCYSNNKRLYLGIETEEELVNDITINLTDIDLYFKDAVFLNSDLSNELKDILKKNGILGEYYCTQQYNMGQYDCYMINLEKLKEYDPEGYNDFEKFNMLEDDYHV